MTSTADRLRNSASRHRLRLLILLICLAAGAQETAWPGEFHLPGVPLPGPGFAGDAGFMVMDWNSDGLPDLFIDDTGSVGRGTIYLNVGTRTEPRFDHGIPYPFNCTETVPQTVEHLIARSWCDLNHDGLPDLILYDGQLRYAPNTGAPQRPYHWQLWPERPHHFPASESMIRENARFATGPESMFWQKGIFARQVITFTAADWDGDGLEDLLICRFRDEAPGAESLGMHEQWTPWGRRALRPPAEPGVAEPDQRYLAPLTEAPARGLYFYRNSGTAGAPHFDAAVEILTPDGQSVAAPNPVVADLDGDGVPDLLATETAYTSNAFRVDWPTRPNAVWFRRPGASPGILEEPRDLVQADGTAIAAGTMLRVADLGGTGAGDLLVMDAIPKGGIRWYRREAGDTPAFAPPIELRGQDFPRFDFSVQPLVVDWFGPNSRDLLLHGITDHHCKWGLNRTALFRNTNPAPGAPRYRFEGYLTWRGDPSLVPVSEQERQYECYGSAIAVAPAAADGRRSILASIGGKHFWLSDLAEDGLTFQHLERLDIPNTSNRLRGWQEIAIEVDFPVRYLRLGNDRNGMGNLRDSMLHLLHLEIWSGDRNLATPELLKIEKTNTETVRWYQIQRPANFLDPQNANTDRELRATSWGYFIGPAIITLAEAARLDRVRFLLSERDSGWYEWLVPFSWQGKIFRMGCEIGEPWYQYVLEVSPDGENWTPVVNRMTTEMMYSHPRLLDWDGDGRVDLLLGVTSANGIYPSTKSYRLYRNDGTNERPRYRDHTVATLADGKELRMQAEWLATTANQGGIVPFDIDGDGALDLVVEAHAGGELRWFRQVGDFQFEPGGSLNADGKTIRYASRNRFFDIADVDGDGSLDLLSSSDGKLSWFKGGSVTPAGETTMPESQTMLLPQTAETLGESDQRVLTVRAQNTKGEDARYVRLSFPPLPKDATFERVELRLCADHRTQVDPNLLVPRLTDEIACLELPSAEADDPATGGRFLAFAPPVFTIGAALWRSWEITEAVRAAQRDGRTLHLLLRFEYTGPYVAGARNTFAGLAWPDAERRPHLLLTR